MNRERNVSRLIPEIGESGLDESRIAVPRQPRVPEAQLTHGIVLAAVNEFA